VILLHHKYVWYCLFLCIFNTQLCVVGCSSVFNCCHCTYSFFVIFCLMFSVIYPLNSWELEWTIIFILSTMRWGCAHITTRCGKMNLVKYHLLVKIQFNSNKHANRSNQLEGNVWKVINLLLTIVFEILIGCAPSRRNMPVKLIYVLDLLLASLELKLEFLHFWSLVQHVLEIQDKVWKLKHEIIFLTYQITANNSTSKQACSIYS
jgi:hypothetical protein